MFAHTLPECEGGGKSLSVLYGQTEGSVAMGKGKSKLEMHLC